MAGNSTSIGRKYAMALSAMFLLLFLIMHLSVNLLSTLPNHDAFNSASHFMGYNPLVQFLLQPVLMFAVVFHFVMGFVLEIKNKSARPIKYAVNNGAANSTWMSRNMLISGAVVLFFLAVHIADYWFPEMTYKYIPGNGDANDVARFWPEMHMKFSALWRVLVYVIGFVLLGLHLAHGFQSSFQSVGARHPKYTPMIKAFGNWYSILIPAGFIFIALFHFFTK